MAHQHTVEKVAQIVDPTAFVCNMLADGTLVIALPEAAMAAREKALKIIAAISTYKESEGWQAIETADWAGEAARISLDAADRPPVRRGKLGSGIQHAAWMLTEIEEGRIIGRKAHRWLGYAQGLLVENGYLTLDEAKLANKQASDAAPPGTEAPAKSGQ